MATVEYIRKGSAPLMAKLQGVVDVIAKGYDDTHLMRVMIPDTSMKGYVDPNKVSILLYKRDVPQIVIDIEFPDKKETPPNG